MSEPSEKAKAVAKALMVDPHVENGCDCQLLCFTVQEELSRVALALDAFAAEARAEERAAWGSVLIRFAEQQLSPELKATFNAEGTLPGDAAEIAWGLAIMEFQRLVQEYRARGQR